MQSNSLFVMLPNTTCVQYGLSQDEPTSFLEFLAIYMEGTTGGGGNTTGWAGWAGGERTPQCGPGGWGGGATPQGGPGSRLAGGYNRGWVEGARGEGGACVYGNIEVRVIRGEAGEAVRC